jgi:hypothetical protein
VRPAALEHPGEVGLHVQLQLLRRTRDHRGASPSGARPPRCLRTHLDQKAGERMDVVALQRRLEPRLTSA